MRDDILFNVETPLGFRVRATRRYWDFLASEKHAVMQDRENDAVETLRDPSEVMRSRSDPDAFLFYRIERPVRWLCVVAKRLNGEGFIITAYPADAIEEGETVWRR